MALEIQIGEGRCGIEPFRAFTVEIVALVVELVEACLGALGEE